MSAEEHRTSPRVPKHFIIRYQDPRAPLLGWFASPVQDLSSHGVRFFCERALKPGDALELQLVLPGLPPVSPTARVVWAKPGRLGMWEIGVTFTIADLGVQRLVDDAVQRQLRKQERSE
jgi:hypothetical protein